MGPNLAALTAGVFTKSSGGGGGGEASSSSTDYGDTFSNNPFRALLSNSRPVSPNDCDSNSSSTLSATSSTGQFGFLFDRSSSLGSLPSLVSQLLEFVIRYYFI
jgi:hypothetical protein